ncbi:hypothetical protein ACFL5J_01460, partial [Thermodesulfobacteriota bacterium]
MTRILRRNRGVTKRTDVCDRVAIAGSRINANRIENAKKGQHQRKDALHLFLLEYSKLEEYIWGGACNAKGGNPVLRAKHITRKITAIQPVTNYTLHHPHPAAIRANPSGAVGNPPLVFLKTLLTDLKTAGTVPAERQLLLTTMALILLTA